MLDEKDDGGDLEDSIMNDGPHYDPDEDEEDADKNVWEEETMESIISHLINVLQDSSMKLESRLLRTRDDLNAFLDNHPEVRI